MFDNGLSLGPGPAPRCDDFRLGGPVVRRDAAASCWRLWYYCRASGFPDDVAPAFGTGAAGTMILAIMTRASLGHTGRALVASPLTTVAYVLVSVAALLRCFGPAVFPQYYNEIMLGAGAAWIGAYASFAIVFTPILTGPRAERKRQAV